jgi:hypothetical protein
LLCAALAISFKCEAVEASRGWCRADPQFMIGGQLVRVTIDARVPNMRAARKLSDGPIKLSLMVPPGMRAEHLASGNGFGDGYSVTVDHQPSHAPTGLLSVRVFVPMNEGIAVRVSIIPSGPADQDASPAGSEDASPGNGHGRPLRTVREVSTLGTANAWIELVA